jgi:ADP-ribose pyrophosphatase YjhB (NUDIX family)
MNHLVTRTASALLITNDSGTVLTVTRPSEDESHAGMQGLPATDGMFNDTPHETAIRAGYEKLGVRVEIGKKLGVREQSRSAHILRLTLYKARIATGSPSIGQGYADVTQYANIRWDEIESLRPTPDAGSLCCQIALEDQ